MKSNIRELEKSLSNKTKVNFFFKNYYLIILILLNYIKNYYQNPLPTIKIW